jgi:hypothetical protein
MRWLGDGLARATTCAGCHVGAPLKAHDHPKLPRREVNHDLIAAGHPRLLFDLPSFHERQPRHWQEPKDYDARTAWAAGQWAAAAAQATLADSRARAGEPPFDFSEQSCYRCHHGLAGGEGRAAPVRLGDGDWGSPYFNSLSVAAQFGGPLRRGALVAMDDLRRQLAPRMRGGAASAEEKAALEKLVVALGVEAPFGPPPQSFKFNGARAPVDWEDAQALIMALRVFEPKSPRLSDSGDLAPLVRFPSVGKGEATWQGPGQVFPKAR